ncbi:MAG: type II secretion system F family protein [bacterium]
MNQRRQDFQKPEFLPFWRKFTRLIRGRVTVLRALDVICREETDPVRKDMISSMKRTVEKGSPLSVATSEYPQHFSSSIVELLKTAEKTGAWEEILPEIVDGLADGTFC